MTTITTTYVQESDRMIQITRDDIDEIIGVNYFQGNEIPMQLPIDQELTDFINYKANEGSVEEVDQLIWMYINKDKYIVGMMHRIEQSISEMIQDNCSSGDVSPSEMERLEEYTNKLADLVAEIVVQNQ
jgi:hypothetical protein